MVEMRVVCSKCGDTLTAEIVTKDQAYGYICLRVSPCLCVVDTEEDEEIDPFS